MDQSANDLLEILLRECSASAPQPLYPGDYARETGVDRSLLDEQLDRLRLGGLIRLTEWVQGKGQGYTVTEAGSEVLGNPRLLTRLRRDGTVPVREEAPLQPVFAVPGSTWERGELVRQALLNPCPPRVTRALLFLNIAVFVAGLFYLMQQGVPLGDYLEDLSPNRNVNLLRDKMGAVEATRVLVKHEWWRLLAHCFIHGGLLHLFCNMYFLYNLGPLVEGMWGNVRFLIMYLVSGLGGGCAIVLSHSAGIGASGALCGVLASMGVWVYMNRGYLPPALSRRWLRAILLNVIIIAGVSMLPFVSAAGHFGGGLAGALVSVPLVFERFHHGPKRILGMLGTLAVPAALVLAMFAMPVSEEDRTTQIASILTETVPELTRTFNTHAKELVNNDFKPAWDDPEKLRAAHEAFARSIARLDANKKELDRMPAFSEPAGQQLLDEVKKLMTDWLEFYLVLDDVLNRRTAWTPELKREIIAKFRNVKNLLQELNPGG
jgi:rhomboid protease GluP